MYFNANTKAYINYNNWHISSAAKTKLQQRWQLGLLIFLDDPSPVHLDSSHGLVHGHQASGQHYCHRTPSRSLVCATPIETKLKMLTFGFASDCKVIFSSY